MDRPTFLQQHHDSGASLIAAFRGLGPINQKIEIDRFLLWSSVYGSLTWQEECLFRAIENTDVDVD